ncbi:MAG: hypothetical protein JXA25_20560 [Anaerolineales bacterium]|nr:hypothetical protein [Anaerolineales bacterium]
MKTYPIQIEGFENQQVEFKPAGLASGPQVLVNGKPAEKGPERGQMLLRRDDGKVATADWKQTMLGFDLPKLVVDGEVIEIVEPLKWYELVWCALPVALITIGGALGALVGVIVFTLNARLFRSDLNPVIRYLLTGLTSFASALVYVLLATLLYTVLNP